MRSRVDGADLTPPPLLNRHPALQMKHEIMSAWTPAEDKMILQLYRQEGRKWAKIASCLENRTSASVRNRFLRIEKGARLRAQGVSKNRCAACGQQKLGHVCPVKLSAVPEPRVEDCSMESATAVSLADGDRPSEHPALQAAAVLARGISHAPAGAAAVLAAAQLARDDGSEMSVDAEEGDGEEVSASASAGASSTQSPPRATRLASGESERSAEAATSPTLTASSSGESRANGRGGVDPSCAGTRSAGTQAVRVDRSVVVVDEMEGDDDEGGMPAAEPPLPSRQASDASVALIELAGVGMSCPPALAALQPTRSDTQDTDDTVVAPPSRGRTDAPSGSADAAVPVSAFRSAGGVVRIGGTALVRGDSGGIAESFAEDLSGKVGPSGDATAAAAAAGAAVVGVPTELWSEVADLAARLRPYNVRLRAQLHVEDNAAEGNVHVAEGVVCVGE